MVLGREPAGPFRTLFIISCSGAFVAFSIRERFPPNSSLELSFVCNEVEAAKEDNLPGIVKEIRIDIDHHHCQQKSGNVGDRQDDDHVAELTWHRRRELMRVDPH